MASPLPLLDPVAGRIRTPVLVVGGSPKRAAELVARLHELHPGGLEVVCYQMDLHQSARLDEALSAAETAAEVVTLPDLWDLPARFQTAIYPVPARGERELKLDLVEQAFHVLVEGGQLLTLSQFRKDDLFGPLLKKIFGSAGSAFTDDGSTFWSTRTGERPRRRHELVVQARLGDLGSVRFLTRPGVFAYTKLDDGARALIEEVEVRAGDRILDLGCGTGITGIAAGLRAGPTGHVTFVDSNVRATALAELNAQSCKLPNYRVVAARRLEGLEEGAFDLVLANPPYYAQLGIAHMFIERGRALMAKGGRFYLVTKQHVQIAPLLAEAFGDVTFALRREYGILCGTGPGEAPAAPADWEWDDDDDGDALDE